MQVSRILDLWFLYGFYRREGRSDEILLEWDRDIYVLVLLNCHLQKQQYWGDMKNNMHEA